MKVKVTPDLANLDDESLFAEVARGCTLVHENANALWVDSSILHVNGSFRSAMLLRAIAEEEAAKYLILLDAIRCPRTNVEQLKRQLSRFNNHLAKGIYAEYADARPATFAEVRCYVEQACEEFYLDGPEGVDYIARNDIFQRREKLMYVDYVELEDRHEWTTPILFDAEAGVPFVDLQPAALRKSNVMHKAGFGTAEALAVIADQWRGVEMRDDLHWSEYRKRNIETLKRFEEKDWLQALLPEEGAVLVDEWTYPMYSLCMKLKRVKWDSLRDQQREWAASLVY